MVSGGEGDDLLSGGQGDDLLLGDDGDDELYGDADNDRLEGGAGNDSLSGGEGNDQLDGGAGTDDLLDGGQGDDVYLLTERSALLTTIVDSDGTDLIDLSQAGIGATLNLLGTGVAFRSGPSSDEDRWVTIDSTSIVENVLGTAFDDVLVGNDADNRLEGGPGNDELRGGAGHDILIGGGGDDVLDGGLGNDVLEGGAGNDVLYAAHGFDKLVGGSGDDLYRIEDSAAVDVEIVDSSGNDTIDFSEWNQPVTVNLSRAKSSGEYQELSSSGSIRLKNSSLTSIENILGTPFADTIVGHPGANELRGGGGDDVLDGRGGQDLLLGEDGFDFPEIRDDGDAAGGLLNHFVQTGTWCQSALQNRPVTCISEPAWGRSA